MIDPTEKPEDQEETGTQISGDEASAPSDDTAVEELPQSN